MRPRRSFWRIRNIVRPWRSSTRRPRSRESSCACWWPPLCATIGPSHCFGTASGSTLTATTTPTLLPRHRSPGASCGRRMTPERCPRPPSVPASRTCASAMAMSATKSENSFSIWSARPSLPLPPPPPPPPQTPGTPTTPARSGFSSARQNSSSNRPSSTFEWETTSATWPSSISTSPPSSNSSQTPRSLTPPRTTWRAVCRGPWIACSRPTPPCPTGRRIPGPGTWSARSSPPPSFCWECTGAPSWSEGGPRLS
mmetsp:Transcript_7828/g.16989  ORF Transcript_7828/g.16989 Transcript_7828/m.16989 type:complete len:255 (-) Transcript_7828:697-1461(-)